MTDAPEPSPAVEELADPVAVARQVVADNRYVVLATADADGLPWASPVWYAARDFREFYWVSRPGATHSQNISARPDVGLMIFDSSRRPGENSGLYARARAEIVPEAEVADGLRVFSAASVADGMTEWDTARLETIGLGLYRARVIEVSVLPKGREKDIRVPVPLA